MNNNLKLPSFVNSLYSLKPFDGLQKPQLGPDHNMDATLGLDLHQSATLNLSSKGMKRKWSGESDSSEDGFSLAFRFGHSPSSSDDSKMSSETLCTLSSAKETDEEISMDLDLNFKLHLGSNEISPSTMKHFVDGEKAVETVLISDRELSLSTGPPVSVITTTSLDSNQHRNFIEAIDFHSGSSDGCRPSQRTSRYSELTYPHPAHIVRDNLSNWPILTEVEPSPSIEDLSSNKAPITPAGSAASEISYMSSQRNVKTCQFQGCGNGARGVSGLCIAHGVGRKCQKEGCFKGADGCTIYCKIHGGGRWCQFLGCTKNAEGCTDYCIVHGGGRRRSHEGCTHASRGRSGLCIRHGGEKRCQMESHKKSAECSFCLSHGGNHRCHFPSCSKGVQGGRSFCKAHGGGKRCTAAGCNKGAEGTTPFCKGHGGGKRCSFQGGGVCPRSVHEGALFCVALGGGKRCATPECTKSGRGRTDFHVQYRVGKRCKSQGCKKSAQGSTDFCKAHGGGKRCLWGVSGSELGRGEPPCDRVAMGKTGLCVVHCALVEDFRVHGGGSVGGDAGGTIHSSKDDKAQGSISRQDDVHTGPKDHTGIYTSWNALDTQANSLTPDVAIPEGRVHGGSLLALFANGTS